MLLEWDKLPEQIRQPEVRPYYDVLSKRKLTLFLKRLFDIVAASILLVVLGIPMLIIGLLIKCDSAGPAIFRQERVTTYGKVFRIHKFRTMITDADKAGGLITRDKDPRITPIGERLRKNRLDELPQLIDILQGNMSFVGTRPETVHYVSMYKPEYMATLLLPAGITSEASLEFRDEGKLLAASEDTDKDYIESILPAKMEINLRAVREVSLISDLRTIFKTVTTVLFHA